MTQVFCRLPKVVTLITLSLFITVTAYAKDELIVYTAIEADELAMFEKEFEADNPDIDLQWGARDSTGIITAKLLAEKNNPQADIVWGLAATSLVFLSNEGYFEGYAPKRIGESGRQICRPDYGPALMGWSASMDCIDLFQYG